MAAKDTGKARQSRITPDYHSEPDAFRTWRRIATIVGLLAAMAYAAYAVSSNQISQISTGPISKVHAHFESDCAACHAEEIGAPIAADAWRWNQDASLQQFATACQSCHQVDGHFRHLLMDDSLDRDCSNCHQEHLGLDHDIAQVSNASCVSCHDQLATVCRASQQMEVSSNISAFAAGAHPDFSWRRADASPDVDPGDIHFNHATHLMPGLVPENARGAFTLGMLGPQYQDRYRKPGQQNASLVELNCVDCHQLGPAGSSVFANADVEQIGSYFLPVNFDQHCAACHELSYAGQTSELLPLPHAAPWKELETVLYAKTKGGKFTGAIRMSHEKARTTTLPGRSQRTVEPLSEVLQNVELNAVLTRVRQRCSQCHIDQHLTKEAIITARSSRAAPLIPTRWLMRGRFDHAAHGAVRRLVDQAVGADSPNGMDCVFCHKINDDATRPDETVVMISGIESCLPCHRAVDQPLSQPIAAALLGGQSTWASADCTMCHRYHWTRRADDHQLTLEAAQE